jgi:ABC-type transporter MlaC component
VTQRDEFASVIQHYGLDGLISNLRRRVDTLQSGMALN